VAALLHSRCLLELDLSHDFHERRKCTRLLELDEVGVTTVGVTDRTTQVACVTLAAVLASVAVTTLTTSRARRTLAHELALRLRA